MKLDNFQKISRLRANAKEMETFWARYNEHITRQNVDKCNAGFGGADRWQSFRVNTFFESHTGIYGDSNCSSFDRFHADTVEPYIVRAMNELAPELFAKAAELMRLDAANLVDAARSEVEAMSAALDFALYDEASEASE